MQLIQKQKLSPGAFCTTGTFTRLHLNSYFQVQFYFFTNRNVFMDIWRVNNLINF